MRVSRQKIAAELILLLEGGPKGKGNSATWKQTLRRLNQQHNQIRAWQTGRGESARPASINGFRLL